MTATGFPTVAASSTVVVAMPSVQPTVVYGPDDRFSSHAEIVKQYLVIQEISMDVVDVDDVRIDFFNCLDKISGCHV